MAHEREVFPTLEDQATGCAEVLHKVNEGDSPTNLNGILGFSFVDTNGDAVLPQLNNEGAIVVTNDAGTCKRDGSINATGSLTYVDLATITLTAEKSYTKLSAIGSAFRDTDYEIVVVDDVGVTDTETIIGNFLSGPGQFTSKFNLESDCFDTIGGTGVIELRLRAINLQKITKTSGYMSVNEIA